MKLPRRCLWRMLLTILGTLAACRPVPPAAPSALPVLPGSSRVERVQAVQARTAGVHTVSAVLAVSYTVGKQQGAFDMVVNYDATGAMRFTALKDTFLSTQILFDLLLQGDTYTLTVQEDGEPRTRRGEVSRFAQEYPTFRTFFLVGEAFFLPGIDGSGQVPHINDAGTRLRTRLRSGVQAHWVARPDTLEITAAELTWQTDDGNVPINLQYADYRPYGASFLPHHIVLRDRQAGFQAVSVVKQLDRNVPLPDDVFRLPATTP